MPSVLITRKNASPGKQTHLKHAPGRDENLYACKRCDRQASAQCCLALACAGNGRSRAAKKSRANLANDVERSAESSAANTRKSASNKRQQSVNILMRFGFRFVKGSSELLVENERDGGCRRDVDQASRQTAIECKRPFLRPNSLRSMPRSIELFDAIHFLLKLQSRLEIDERKN